MANITVQYSLKINGQRNGHRLSKPPITAYHSHFPGTHSPRRSPLLQVRKSQSSRHSSHRPSVYTRVLVSFWKKRGRKVVHGCKRLTATGYFILDLSPVV
ncbi:hypothetical protein FocTR4_00006376 [Fusarium oxysporum f. sp. cubense]|uniref:Uncharacterized protein n=1 Tax=Fusarium oxysporum f. sp. cubense TaxID=61366 RepID=A0A5C6TMI8_FUSOC|nr:hypothetical protein FocTR4_00006376 [Fusarium oxysporum f. sp. cubense]